MRKRLILTTVLCLFFFTQGHSSEDKWADRDSSDPISRLKMGDSNGFSVGQSSQTQQWEMFSGNFDTVVIGYDPIEKKSLVYATELSSGDIYQFLDGWRKIGGPGSMFVADHTGHLYGLARDKSAVYEYSGTPGSWTKVGGPAESIYAGNTRVYAINPQTRDIYEYIRELKQWRRIGGPGSMFATDHSGHLYGLAMDKSAVYEYSGTPGQWKKIGGAATSIYAGGDRLYAASPNSGNIHEYSRELNKWSDLGIQGIALAVDFHGRLFGISSDKNEVFIYERAGGRKKIGGAAEKIFSAMDMLYALNASQELFRTKTPAYYPVMTVDDSKTTQPTQSDKPHIKQAEGYAKAIPLPSGPPPELNPSEFYKITSKASDQFVDLRSSGGKDGEPISAYESHAGDGQRWQFVPLSDGYFRIRSKIDGKSLTAHDAGDEWGILIVIWEWQHSENQMWKIAPVSDDYYAIISKADDKCLDLMSKTQLYFKPSAWVNKDSQQWKIITPLGEVCEKASVQIESIYIAKADDFGPLGEAGDHAEWRLKIEVNDREWHWEDEYVKDGMTVDLGWRCSISPLNETATIRIAASGIESDSIGDDQLPAAIATHNSSGNWGIGPTRELVGKNKDFHYVITYSIRCVE